MLPGAPQYRAIAKRPVLDRVRDTDQTMDKKSNTNSASHHTYTTPYTKLSTVFSTLPCSTSSICAGRMSAWHGQRITADIHRSEGAGKVYRRAHVTARQKRRLRRDRASGRALGSHATRVHVELTPDSNQQSTAHATLHASMQFQSTSFKFIVYVRSGFLPGSRTTHVPLALSNSGTGQLRKRYGTPRHAQRATTHNSTVSHIWLGTWYRGRHRNKLPGAFVDHAS